MLLIQKKNLNMLIPNLNKYYHICNYSEINYHGFYYCYHFLDGK